MTYTKGCDTIYRVLEDVKETLSKTRRWAARQSAEKLTGAQGCNVERELVKIDGRNRSNVQRDAETLAAVDDANVECGTAIDMAYHNHPSRRPQVVGAEREVWVSKVRLIRSRESVKTLGQEPARRSFRIGVRHRGQDRAQKRIGGQHIAGRNESGICIESDQSSIKRVRPTLMQRNGAPSDVISKVERLTIRDNMTLCGRLMIFKPILLLERKSAKSQLNSASHSCLFRHACLFKFSKTRPS